MLCSSSSTHSDFSGELVSWCVVLVVTTKAMMLPLLLVVVAVFVVAGVVVSYFCVVLYVCAGHPTPCVCCFMS